MKREYLNGERERMEAAAEWLEDAGLRGVMCPCGNDVGTRADLLSPGEPWPTLYRMNTNTGELSEPTPYVPPEHPETCARHEGIEPDKLASAILDRTFIQGDWTDAEMARAGSVAAGSWEPVGDVQVSVPRVISDAFADDPEATA